MEKIFDENDYNFIDSVIDGIRLDENMRDFLIDIDYFFGPTASKMLTLRLVKAKNMTVNISYFGDHDIVTPYTICDMTTRKTDDGLIKVEISIAACMLSGCEDLPNVIECLCEEVLIGEKQ